MTTIKQLKNKLLKKSPNLEKELKEDLKNTIGNIVMNARIKKGFTQAELAKKMGTKQPSIARIENGSVLPSLSYMKRLAEAMDNCIVIEFIEK